MTTIGLELREPLLERFLRYARIETTSDPHGEGHPSSPQQWDLLKLLEEELKALGIREVELDQHGYLLAKLPGNQPEGAVPTIGFIAHVDTSPEVSGKGVEPMVHRNYHGSTLFLANGEALDPQEYPELALYRGNTIITASGATLLGADNKAGIAEIMEALAWLIAHPDHQRGDLEILFTCDEEIGKGLDLFDPKRLSSRCCYTVDGSHRGAVEAECFHAAAARIVFTGKVMHLGTARGKMVNALTMAASFISRLPVSESPETTDGRLGFYAPLEFRGEASSAELDVYLRDFERDGLDRRKKALSLWAEGVAAAFPGSRVEVTFKDQYANMREFISDDLEVLEKLEAAIVEAGVQPHREIIRGGTDGARLSEMGIPTPNIFTGGYNFHSLHEWACLEVMAEASETLVHLTKLWAKA